MLIVILVPTAAGLPTAVNVAAEALPATRASTATAIILLASFMFSSLSFVWVFNPVLFSFRSKFTVFGTAQKKGFVNLVMAVQRRMHASTRQSSVAVRVHPSLEALLSLLQCPQRYGAVAVILTEIVLETFVVVVGILIRRSKF